jgi:transcriptional regulator with XRE-family HTH domain
MPSQQGSRADAATGDNPVVRLGTKLQELQRRTGKSLKELESVVHVSDSSLSRYLAGRAVPPWAVVEGLSLLVGQDPASLHPLWDQAHRTRHATGEVTNGAINTPDPVAEPTVEQQEEAPTRPRRRNRRWLLVGAFVATALLFATAGVLIGRQFGVRVVMTKPTEDSACRAWPWPDNAGQAVQPPVHPQAPDHAPTVELMVGKATDGRNAAWARITNAEFGDRVWLDLSSDGARSWTQCGPFPVTTSTGTSRAHDTGPNMLLRACGDVPTPAPNARGEICTNW